MRTGALLIIKQELYRSQGDSQTPMYVNKHQYMPASSNTAFDANALITALARDIALDADAAKLADAGRQWYLLIYTGVSISERYLARATTKTMQPGSLKLDTNQDESPEVIEAATSPKQLRT